MLRFLKRNWRIVDWRNGNHSVQSIQGRRHLQYYPMIDNADREATGSHKMPWISKRVWRPRGFCAWHEDLLQRTRRPAMGMVDPLVVNRWYLGEAPSDEFLPISWQTVLRWMWSQLSRGPIVDPGNWALDRCWQGCKWSGCI